MTPDAHKTTRLIIVSIVLIGALLTAHQIATRYIDKMGVQQKWRR